MKAELFVILLWQQRLTMMGPFQVRLGFGFGFLAWLLLALKKQKECE
jgi:hypothetical protein